MNVLKSLAVPTSRPYTAEEVRARLISHVRHLAEYWATTDLTRPEFKITTPEQDRLFRCEGVVHSMLVMLDGGTLDLPAFDLVPSPNPEDKQYCIDNDENWYEPVVINDCQLHELLH